jgi:hypothetical protein
VSFGITFSLAIMKWNVQVKIYFMDYDELARFTFAMHMMTTQN